MKKTKVDAQPTEEQVGRLCRMMYYAFVEIRLLAASGDAGQIGALANAFHNLLSRMLSGGSSGLGFGIL